MLAAYGARSDAVLERLLAHGYDVSVAVDSSYVRLPDGRIEAMVPVRPLDETPSEVLDGRFFALATRV